MNKTQKKHVILLIISCVLLVASVSGSLIAFAQLGDQLSAPPEQENPIGQLISGLVAVLMYLMALAAVLLVCVFVWGLGFVLSAYSAFRKQEMSRPVWICSVILSAIYGVLTMGALGMLSYMAIRMFTNM